MKPFFIFAAEKEIENKKLKKPHFFMFKKFKKIFFSDIDCHSLNLFLQIDRDTEN